MSLDGPAIVNTKSGKLEGTIKKGLYVFKGIPYAVPPVGSLRWMPPQPVKTWNGVRPAKDYGAIAPQPVMPGMKAMGAPDFTSQPQSEDCLFLNVWTPGLDDAKRPVYFWIHGGAFFIGAGSDEMFEAGTLPRRGDIVMVSINYRLGALGFLNWHNITGGKIPATGNEAMLDQVAALDWVRENIAAFGGDPNNVTISGFSAGGESVSTLLSLPAARGKFHKALGRSGADVITGPRDFSDKVAEKFLKILNLKNKDVDALRALTGQQVLDAQQQLVAFFNQTDHRTAPFQPVVDGKILPELPLAAIKKGAAKNIPVMAGTSIDEMKFMTTNGADADIDEPGMIARLNSNVPPKFVPGLVKSYTEILKKYGGPVTPARILGSINTDRMFRIPTIRLVAAQRDNGAPAYNYLFTYKSPAMGGAMGAIHGIDNPFLFGALDKDFTGIDQELEDLALKVQESAIAFMKTGDPSSKSGGKWPVYGKERMTMVFDRKSGVVAAPYEAERTAWDKFD
jgi:para-nitrobenzyl esterase